MNEVKASQTSGVENGARPHPGLLPLGEGKARAARGVTGAVAGAASQGSVKPL